MIRRRLTAMIVVLVAVVGIVAALAIMRTLEARLLADIDEELDVVPDHIDLESADNVRQQLQPAVADARRVAVIRTGPQGSVILALPSGPADAQDPLPDIQGVTAPSGPMTVNSVEGSNPRYRAKASTTPNGGMVVTAISLADVDGALADARQVMLGASLLAMAAVAMGSWVLIRLGLRPVDRMVLTAQRIADGHITERVPVRSPDSEVGQLGTALNRMLDRVSDAFDARTASEQRMRRFVADASHELRTPLTAIRGYAELSTHSADPDEREAAMARVEQAAVRMAALVDDLVLLARLDQGRPLATDPLDLSQVVLDAVADARTLEPERQFEIIAPVVGTTVFGDRARLRQVVDNLLANVREHTPAYTRVAITVVGRNDGVVLVVRDDGPGMLEDDAIHAFDRFWQAPATDAHPRRGTGLGLAIVADLVHAHGGTIELETAPGQGTCVTVRLPRERERARVDSQVSPRSP
jgi:two-component system, OmpR family, sensor kinase